MAALSWVEQQEEEEGGERKEKREVEERRGVINSYKDTGLRRAECGRQHNIEFMGATDTRWGCALVSFHEPKAESQGRPGARGHPCCRNILHCS